MKSIRGNICIKRVLALLAAAGLAIAIACSGAGDINVSAGDSAGDALLLRDGRKKGSISPEPHRQVVSVSEGRRESSGMGSAPYFRDDAGKNTQLADGYLYGYWRNRLCRVDLKTFEETVLYEAASPQHGDFCIWEDYIYFMVVPKVNAVGKVHGYLYRVKCDGSEEAACLASVIMPGQGDGGQYYKQYKLDTYEDILYLMEQYDEEENQFFRLNLDGSIARVPESETLYGQLPKGYSAQWKYNTFVTLPYAMRNYGYVFAKDDNENLVRIDLDSQQAESLDVLKDYAIRAITYDAVVLEKDAVWYRASLDDINEITMIGEPYENSFYIACNSKGLYFSQAYGGESSYLYLMDWEGEKTTLQYNFIKEQFSPMEYIDESYYYYVVQVMGDDVVKRLSLTGNEDAEKVAVYGADPYWGITNRESIHYGWTDEHTGASVDYEIEKVYFKEDTGAFGKINDFLDDRYTQDMNAVEDYKKEVNEEFDWDYYEKWGAEYVECSDSYSVCYLDEKYVGIYASWYLYLKGAAHGMYGSSYYMFDRHTGERVFIADVVQNSPEEICGIIAPYIEAVAAWGIDEEGWEDVILEEGRFYLSEEGIGIHFDVYEIDCYAAGDQEIIVPYTMFDMK